MIFIKVGNQNFIRPLCNCHNEIIEFIVQSHIPANNLYSVCFDGNFFMKMILNFLVFGSIRKKNILREKYFTQQKSLLKIQLIFKRLFYVKNFRKTTLSHIMLNKKV